MARIVINPEQTQIKAIYQDKNGNNVVFDRDNGYCFSDDASMDEIIDDFKARGFKLKGEKAGISNTVSEPVKSKKLFEKKEDKSE